LPAPQTRANTENPIGQHPRPAASCFGGYRTPPGARFPSQTRTLRRVSWLAESSHSFSAIISISPSSRASLGKTQSGTHSGKVDASDTIWRDRQAASPKTDSFTGMSASGAASDTPGGPQPLGTCRSFMSFIWSAVHQNDTVEPVAVLRVPC